MKTYSSMTVGDLINWCDKHPGATIRGMSSYPSSYRGYYEHVALEPGGTVSAPHLADVLRENLGETMHGYKGGEYTIREGCYVFLADDGATGPSLAGFEYNPESGYHEPVGLEQAWF